MNARERQLAAKVIAAKKEREQKVFHKQKRDAEIGSYISAKKQLTQERKLHEEKGSLDHQYTHKNKAIIYSQAVKHVNLAYTANRLRRVNRHPNPHPQKPKKRSTEPEVNSTTEGDTREDIPDTPLLDRSTEGQIRRERKVKEEKEKVWAKIYKHQLQEYNDGIQKKKYDKTREAQTQSKALQTQLMRQKEEREAEKEENKKWGASFRKAAEDHAVEDKAKAAARRQQNLKQQQRFIEQRQSVERRRQREAQRRIADEREEVRAAQRAIENEKVKVERAKQRQREEHARVIKENAELEATKKEKRHQEIEFELKLEQQYQEKLAAEESTRAAGLQAIYKRQEKLLDIGLYAQTQWADKLREDEERAVRVQREVEARVKAEMEAKERKRMQEAQQQNKFLRLQMQQQEEARRRQREGEREELQQLRQRAMEEERVEKAKQAGLAVSKMQHSELLKDQIKEGRRRKQASDPGMTPLEMQLNSRLLQAVEGSDAMRIVGVGKRSKAKQQEAARILALAGQDVVGS